MQPYNKTFHHLFCQQLKPCRMLQFCRVDVGKVGAGHCLENGIELFSEYTLRPGTYLFVNYLATFKI